MDRDDNRGATRAKCPYFIRETHGKIICEGVKGCSNVSMDFKNKTKKYRYETMNCFKINSNCELRKMLNKRYEDQEK